VNKKHQHYVAIHVDLNVKENLVLFPVLNHLLVLIYVLLAVFAPKTILCEIVVV
jgi:hypothetical protein